ncbi:transcription factor HHO5-like [Impatiens glandulifera]|uniref:transcription factor HHO5-like n=1 Tax=Impatiens glandulifera TaxID=253017 RepID=UPI001FB18B7A|nr:transcription factor HHO5-like [Impatiens glandulifera]
MCSCNLVVAVIQIMKEEATNYRRLNLQAVGYLQLMNKSDENRDKKTWLSSAQLWKTDDSKNCDVKKNWIAVGDPMNNNGKGKKPLLNLTAGCSMFPVIRARNEERVELPISGLSLVIPGMKIDSVSKIYYSEKGNSSSTPVSQSNLRIVPHPAPVPYRKERRSWSKDLHRRFVAVLQLLGGSNVATPKQIREHMKVDGLTNDEVKSHLQKYRLHKRKTEAAAAAAEENYRPRIGLGGGSMMMTLEEYTKSNHRSSLSGSPQGPLDLTVGKGDLNVGNGGGGTSVEEEDESYDRKNQVKGSG